MDKNMNEISSKFTEKRHGGTEKNVHSSEDRALDQLTEQKNRVSLTQNIDKDYQ